MVHHLLHWVGNNNTFTHSTVRAPVFGRHQFFGTSDRALRKSPWMLLSGWMNYNYTSCCWFPTSSNILILPPQFWQIRFESCWLLCSKCRILVLLRYMQHYPLLSNFDVWCTYQLSPPPQKKKKKKITIRLSASITFKIMNQSKYALGW